MIQWLRKLYNPPVFQGNFHKKDYFEGWYFKCVSPEGERFAFIPGVSLHEGDDHAFVQFIHGETGKTEYFRFPVESFEYRTDRLYVTIGENVFTESFMEVHLDGPGFQAHGKVSFHEMKKLPARLFSPGIMGWYSFMPFMECYHGLVSIDHRLSGEVRFREEIVSLDEGRGYIEKDWGTSFPRSWIWMQSNHFGQKGISFMFSVAKIPWLGSEFDGFLCVFLYQGRIHRFATYTGAKVTSLEVRGTHIAVVIASKSYKIIVHTEKEKEGALAAPVLGEMKRTIHESLNSRIHLEFYHKNKKIFSGTGVHAGCEIVGNEPWFR